MYWLRSFLVVVTSQLSHVVLAQGRGTVLEGWCGHGGKEPSIYVSAEGREKEI